MSERLPRLTPDQLTPAQAEVYEAIQGGPRASGPQLFELKDPQGGLNGPFGIMLHHPGLGLALQELGAAVRYRTGLDPRAREIAILQVGVHERSAFEWYAHEAVGRHVGLSDEGLIALSEGSFTSGDPTEEAVARFTDVILSDAEISQAEYDEFEQALGAETLVELIVLAGYYRTLASMMRIFAVGVPGES